MRRTISKLSATWSRFYALRRGTVTGVLALMLAATSPAQAACPEHRLAVRAHQQTGPTCLVAAALSALSAHGAPETSVQSLARLLPVWPDGIDWYDLAVQLERQGWEARLFTGPPEAAARLVEAGFPVVALTTVSGKAHAVTMHGVQRTASKEGCGPGLARVLLMDPRTGKSTWTRAETFAQAQSQARLLALYRPEDRAKLATADFPAALATRVDRRLRSQALLRRAEKHPYPNTQQLHILREAVGLDPCWPPAREMLVDTATRLNRLDIVPPPPKTCPSTPLPGGTP